LDGLDFHWLCPPASLLPSLGLTKASVAAAPSKDKGEFLPVLLWAAEVESLAFNICFEVVVLVLLLLSFGGGALLAMGSFREFLLKVSLLVVALEAVVGLVVADVEFFSPDVATVVSAMADVFCVSVDTAFFRLAVDTAPFFDNVESDCASVATFGGIRVILAGDDGLAVDTDLIETDNNLVVLAVIHALVEASLVSLETVDLIRRSNT
jgi:hypothetical protein